MDKTRYSLLTNDVETTSIWFNRSRDETGYRVFREGMPMLLELYAKYNIKSTFFFLGDMALKWPEIVKMILPYGHEVASHGWSHEVTDAFDVMPLKTQAEHLKKSKALLEDISGQEVITFRAPALRINENTPRALIEAGFKIDSSIASQRMDMFFSFGSRNKLSWIFAPRSVYNTCIDTLARKGNSDLIEVPLKSYFLPFNSTFMRISPLLHKGLIYCAFLENKITHSPLVFLIHPNEFIDESSKTRQINRRSKYYLNYLVKDVIRGKLKVKNLGNKSYELYLQMILLLNKNNFTFVTIKDYVNEFRGI